MNPLEPPPRLGSLCTGAAGLDMAVEAVFGTVTVWQAEHEPATEKNPNPTQGAARVLVHRFPGVPNLGDLTSVDWASAPRVDVLCAGYPCQPDSLAGKGLSDDDHRWIWPDIARAVGVLRPRLVVLENVAGHFVRGFRTVLGSLTDLGYDTQWTLVRASDVGAPHRRERLFVVATDTSDSRRKWRWPESQRRARDTAARGDSATPHSDDRGQAAILARRVEPRQPESPGDRIPPADTQGDGRNEGWPEPTGLVRGSDVAVRGAAFADSDGDGLSLVGRQLASECHPDGRSGADTAWGVYEPAIRRWENVVDRRAPAPTEPGARGGQRLSPRFVEWLMGWPAGWVTDVPGITRNDQLKICGNGVVPQQAEYALRLLLAAADLSERVA